MVNSLSSVSPYWWSRRGGGISQIFYDSFTGNNNTNIASRLPDIGNNWVANVGLATIQSNKAKGGGTGNTNYSAEMNAADCTLQVDLDINTGESVFLGFSFRVTDSANRWIAIRDIAGGLWAIYSIASGASTLRTSLSEAASGLKVISLVLSGNNITFKVDGIEKLTYSSSYLATNTKHGIQFGASTLSTFDNFTVTP